jgi:CxxC motif-containing protein (DUF1111 family)
MRTALPRQFAALLTACIVWGQAANAEDQIDGEMLFKRNWTSAETATDGLGPLFNEASCHACHWNGGGARISVRPDGEVAAAGVLVRLINAQGQGDPHYGQQLQNKAVAGLAPEGVADIRAETDAAGLTGFVTNLRLRQGVELSAGHSPSLRAAPALDVAGLIEAIPDEVILQGQDPDDRDGDGISGRAHLLQRTGQTTSVGKFNWKATQPSVAFQVATAFDMDMGLGTSLVPRAAGDCTMLQTACMERAGNTQAADVSDDQVEALAGFVRSLAVPVETSGLPSAAAFEQAGCAACHVPALRDLNGAPVPLYSDLLLHDMGPGLASTGAEGDAAPGEWRTTPLIGYRGAVAGHRYLHDGRAANIDEAIRWHDGEARPARERYEAMSAAERLELTAFVQALLSALPVPDGLALSR